MKVGEYRNYLSNVNRVERGKIQSIQGNRIKFSNAAYLVTVDRVFNSQEDAERYKLSVQAGNRKGWRTSTEERWT